MIGSRLMLGILGRTVGTFRIEYFWFLSAERKRGTEDDWEQIVAMGHREKDWHLRRKEKLGRGLLLGSRSLLVIRERKAGVIGYYACVFAKEFACGRNCQLLSFVTVWCYTFTTRWFGCGKWRKDLVASFAEFLSFCLRKNLSSVIFHDGLALHSHNAMAYWNRELWKVVKGIDEFFCCGSLFAILAKEYYLWKNLLTIGLSIRISPRSEHFDKVFIATVQSLSKHDAFK